MTQKKKLTQDEVKALMNQVEKLTYRDLDTLEGKDVWALSAILHSKLAFLEKLKYSRIRQAWGGHGAYREKKT